MDQLLLGKAKVDITPQIGIHMSGWAGERYSNTIHQPLTCRVFYLQQGDSIAALVSLDLLGIENKFADEIRKEVERQLGIVAGHIMLSCTHTHSGPILEPCIFPNHPAPDETYKMELKRKIIDAIRAARQQLVPVVAGYGEGACNLAVNRRLRYDNGKCNFPPKANPEGLVDQIVGVLRLDTLEGETAAVLFSYGCHPTVGGDSLWLGPDYPGSAREVVENYYGEDMMAMFVLGNCGDVRSNYTLPDHSFDWNVSMEKVEEAGCRVGFEVLQTVVQIKPNQNLELRTSRIFKDIFMKNGNKAVSCEFQAFRIGDCYIVTNPGECFAEIGLNVRKAFDGPILFSSITNGLLGYVPTAKEHPYEGYEVSISYSFFGLEKPINEDGEQVFYKGMLEVLELCKNS